MVVIILYRVYYDKYNILTNHYYIFPGLYVIKDPKLAGMKVELIVFEIDRMVSVLILKYTIIS